MLATFQNKHVNWQREMLRNKGLRKTVVLNAPDGFAQALAAAGMVRLLREQGCDVIYQVSEMLHHVLRRIPQLRLARKTLKPDVILSTHHKGNPFAIWMEEINRQLDGISIPKLHNCRLKASVSEAEQFELAGLYINPNHISGTDDGILVATPDIFEALIATALNIPVSTGESPLLTDQSDWCNQKLPAHGISAIIPLYKPDVVRVNRCLKCVLPQVDEVLFVPGADSPETFPGLITDPKIRIVRGPRARMGYARKANFGFRHSCGKWIWLLNDDMYADPDVAEKCVALLKSDHQIGAVTHSLYYPNGLVQYAGKYRVTGATNFGHTFWKEKIHTLTEPVEQECFCAASLFFSRKAFYAAEGFSDRWYMYCDDDSCALRIRRAGYKVVFEPRVKGIHEEHVTAKLIPDWKDELQKSNDEFARVWGKYFMHNPDVTELGSFDRVPEIFD
jgi:GT2 family glycosyltransferase